MEGEFMYSKGVIILHFIICIHKIFCDNSGIF